MNPRPALTSRALPPGRDRPADRCPQAAAGRQLRALDLFCGAGGATRGLQNAGFHVTGVDIKPQPRYCGEAFVQTDAMSVPMIDLQSFDFIWASPPCQAYTNAQRIRGNSHPDLIAPTRARLWESRVPFCIENVPGAPLIHPIELCGSMFGLRTYRHRLFECSFPVTAPVHREHKAPLAKMGRPAKPHEFLHVVGNFSGAQAARDAMAIDWMHRDGLREAIPPAYSEFIARAFLSQFQKEGAGITPPQELQNSLSHE